MLELAERIRRGDVRALARAATAVENCTPEGRALLAELSPQAGTALVVGVTGPPGSGKSTLVDQMTRWLRQQSKTVGILTVDPSSPLSGGALLGDRIRMQRHHNDPGVFIRSMATRGSLGGLAQATADLATLLGAAGKDVVLIETVGVGQDEVEIARVADLVLLVLVPGLGDDIQAIKAGVMEIADIFVVNKADLPGAERVEAEIRSVLSLKDSPDSRRPPVLRTVATDGTGIEELIQAVRELAATRRGAPRRMPSPFGRFPVDHLGVAVPSLDEALRFWEKLLGMRLLGIEDVVQEKVRVAMLEAGPSRVELLEASAPDSVVARFLEKRGPGLHHLALRVPDLAATLARLRNAGVRILGEPQIGAGGHRYVFVHPASTGGVLLELIEGG
ncbi:MAG: methylmalonyl Co-A mutase-associated GTPase MeaB [Bryobacterales bacterium]|nr:methylmalonyl Co-A mutase-associated GTPase MeaB [Bryobacteraceae bacterium]MDW8355333.1 methylmalonyl Co-A mutase-associated GTPase MeaB [Bryobacterales bacterium]